MEHNITVLWRLAEERASAVALVSNVADGGTFLRAGGVIDITNAGQP